MKRVVLIIIGSLLLAIPVQADQLKSSNYEIDESFVGGGGLINESSSHFQANESIGDVGIGNSSSTNFQVNAGYTTTSDPALTFIVNTTAIGFGVLSRSSTATATSTFSVINYTSYGYVVQTLGPPPTSGSHTLTGMSSTTTSQVGVEQYGINLRANTSPTTFGADPSQQPNSTFGFGAAASGYNTPNQYKYVSGDTIASATKSSGETDYTISYVANMAINTPGGTYTGTQILVCTGTY